MASFAFAACNAPNEGDLFGDPDPYAQFTTGGRPASGGATTGSGGFLSTGGAALGGTGGKPQSGGGGVVIPSGGGGGLGGFQSTGGIPNGGGGAGGSEAFDVTKCNFTGAWASYVTIPTTWPKTLVLLEGQGTIQQWSLTLQEQKPDSPVVKARTYPCGITLPDLESQFFGQKTKFGIRFPDQLFDRGVLPNAPYEMRAVPTAAGPELVSQPFALLAGSTMADSVTDKWPPVTDMTLSDDDKDGDIGIRVVAATGPGYSLPPSNIFGELATFIDITERTVHRYHGPVRSCDEFEAELEILTVAGKPAIDSTVVGCVKENGGKCTPGDAQFIDSNRPQYLAGGIGKLRTHRIPDGSKCEDVRAFYAARGGN
jgi:hypothetical protein